MCTVVVRWAPHAPVLLLALRDELVGRPFDDPGRWWPEQPQAVGGRDQVAGGTWCVTDVPTGSTALVLNRPQRRVAAQGAPSRGVLPLLAVRHGGGWPAHLELAGMASFALVLASPDAVTVWEFDGARLTSSPLPPGTHMVTSGGAEDGKVDRHLRDFVAADTAELWPGLAARDGEQDDLSALLVRHRSDGSTWATVFGQLLKAQPGRLAISSSRTPAMAQTWEQRTWP